MKKLIIIYLTLFLFTNISFADSCSYTLKDNIDAIFTKSFSDLELVNNSLDSIFSRLLNNTIDNDSISFNKSILNNIATKIPHDYEKLSDLNLKNKYLRLSIIGSNYAMALSYITLYLDSINNNHLNNDYLYSAIVNYTDGKFNLLYLSNFK